MTTPRQAQPAGAPKPWKQGVSSTGRHWVHVPGLAKGINAGTADRAALIVAAVNAYSGLASMSDDMRSFIEGMSVSIDVSTGEADAGNRYFGTVTEVMDDPADKHGVTLLVQDAEPNFAIKQAVPPEPLQAAAQPEHPREVIEALLHARRHGQQPCEDPSDGAALERASNALLASVNAAFRALGMRPSIRDADALAATSLTGESTTPAATMSENEAALLDVAFERMRKQRDDLKQRLFEALESDPILKEGLEQVDHAGHLNRTIYSRVLDVACAQKARADEAEARLAALATPTAAAPTEPTSAQPVGAVQAPAAVSGGTRERSS